MAYLQVSGGDDRLVWRVAGRILSKQLTRGGPSVSVLIGELTTLHRKEIIAFDDILCKN
jgi:hypothetical protein